MGVNSALGWRELSMFRDEGASVRLLTHSGCGEARRDGLGKEP
jgi:hypothetical protein